MWIPAGLCKKDMLTDKLFTVSSYLALKNVVYLHQATAPTSKMSKLNKRWRKTKTINEVGVFRAESHKVEETKYPNHINLSLRAGLFI